MEPVLLIDVQTVRPMDMETINTSAPKTETRPTDLPDQAFRGPF